MAGLFNIGATAVFTAALALPLAAQQQPAGDRDDQIVITGCVMRPQETATGTPRTLLVWSKGDVFFDVAAADIKPSERPENPVGTTGNNAPIFYWIDDEDDFAKHAGMRVEIVGELSDSLDRGEFEVNHQPDFTEIEIDFEGILLAGTGGRGRQQTGVKL